jgi:hypothetical protein
MFNVIVGVLFWSCDVQGGVGVWGVIWICYITIANIGLCMSVKAPFIYSFCLLRLYT